MVSELELWGGVECTVNRVGDTYFDQLERTGHAARLEDLDRLVELGVRTVRYPILWERCSREGLGRCDFSWADERMHRLRELGIRTIVGLVHHGSGPRGTSLVEPNFAQGLARFAGEVARRYPWVTDYTPVNEPLTTARFSALYGHWYPHARDTRSFLRALMVQTRATALSMREIRKISPEARLVQTEDFGSVFSTRKLKYQADFENRRKWLSLDLLYGHVGPDHPLYEFLVYFGIRADELEQLVCEPCRPDLIGVNYYVTSDRYLDEQVFRYPEGCIGSNGRERYADVEAVRVRRKGIVGHRDVLLSAWTRYRTAVALTEVHLGCTPEEQVRWLNDAWRGAEEAKQAGADVRGVTLWSVFGAFDWDSLVTQARGNYEPGAFDVQGPTPCRTALARVAADLASSGSSTETLLSIPGWWRRPSRLCYRIVSSEQTVMEGLSRTRPVLILGKGGMFADAFQGVCAERGIAVRCPSRDGLDEPALERVLADANPWLVVHAAGIPWNGTAVDDKGLCAWERTHEYGILARVCRELGARLIVFSSALVFGCENDQPYLETEPMNPYGMLGASIANAERLVLQTYPDALVVRPGAIFDITARNCQIGRALRRLAVGDTVSVSRESYWSLAHAPELAHRCLDLSMAHQSGVVHLAHESTWTVYEFMCRLAEAVGLPTVNLIATDHEHCRIFPRMPMRAVLASCRVRPLSRLESCLAALARVANVHERKPKERAA